MTQGHLRYMSQDLEKKDIGWILTSWKSMAAFSFTFMGSGLCLSFPPKPMAVRVLWALMSLTGPDQLLPSAQEPCFSSELGTRSLPELCYGHVSELAFWTDPCCSPVSSPTSRPCLLDGPWNWLITLPCLRLLMGFIAMTTWLCRMFRPCR